MPNSPDGFQTRPLTTDTMPDFEALASLRGGAMFRQCWCVFYRLSGQAVWGKGTAARQQVLCDLAASDLAPGLLGYLDGQPVGWISLGPREDFAKLRRSAVMKPVDDRPVWSVVCSYVAQAYRGQGLQRRLLAAAIDFARDNGATTLEAYPVDKRGRDGDDSIWFGSRSLYEQAGFLEVVRRSPTRVVMRRELR